MFQTKISELTARGYGVGSLPDGRKCFLFGVYPGEEVTFNVETDQRGRLQTQVIQILSASPDRIDPECTQHRRCPGCPFRAYTQQATEQFLRSDHLALLKKKGIELSQELKNRAQLLPSISRNAYRARLSAEIFQIESESGSRLIAGMRGLHDAPVDLSECPAQTQTCRILLKKVMAALSDAQFYPMPFEGEQGLRQVILHAPDVIESNSGGASPILENARVIVCFSGNADPTPVLQKLGQELPSVSFFAESCHPKSHDFLKAPKWVSGPTKVELPAVPGFHRTSLCATLPAWMPQAPSTLPYLIPHVLEKLQVQSSDRILEIGCGIGTLSLPIADRCRSFLGIDIVREAIEDAKVNAERADIKHATFRQGQADRAVKRIIRDHFDSALLHAMRLPFGEEVLPLLSLTGIKRIVYLAPNISSLAEDLKRSPFILKSVDFQDQSPGSTGLMTIAYLERP